MKISKDEQNKKCFRLSNSIRSICLTLCLTLIIGISPVYANTVNISVPDNLFSYIVKSDGTVDFTSTDAQGISATSKLTWYFGRLSQTIARIGSFTYQNGTYLATIYTYFSAALSDIKTYSQNTAAATNALLQLTGDQVNIDWVLLNSGSFVNSSLTQVTSATTVNDPYNYYFKFNFYSSDNLGVIKVELPVSSNSRYVRDFDFTFYDIDNSQNYVQLNMKYVYTYNVNKRSLELYITNFSYNYSNMLIQVTAGGNNYYVNPANDIKAYYIQSTREDYLKVVDFIYLNSMDKKLDALQDLEVNVEVNDSINVTPIDLDVQIGINDFTEVNTISNKLRTWLSTGVGVSALIGALDQLDDSFFTLHNRNVIETINSGYTDFYD